MTATQVPLTLRDRWIKRTPLLLIAAFLIFRFFAIYDFWAPKHLDVSKLDLQTIGGTSISQAQLQGKAVLLNYWAPWCGPCLTEVPALRQLQADHPKDLLVIGVVSDPADYLQAILFMKDNGVSYPIAKETPTLQKTVGTVTGIPMTFYIAPSGTVVHRVDGVVSEKLMKRYLADALHGS